MLLYARTNRTSLPKRSPEAIDVRAKWASASASTVREHLADVGFTGASVRELDNRGELRYRYISSHLIRLLI